MGLSKKALIAAATIGYGLASGNLKASEALEQLEGMKDALGEDYEDIKKEIQNGEYTNAATRLGKYAIGQDSQTKLLSTLY